MNEILIPIAIFGIGVVSSFINVMAGGGSVLTLGVMMLLGLDASVANGTNRIGIIASNISAIAAYKSEEFGNIKKSLSLGIFAIPGAIIGSLFAINISNQLFQRILSLVMILIIITLFLPKEKSQFKKGESKIRKFLVYPAMFFAGLYGGFIQAGVGFILMASLRHLTGMELVKINMHKIYVVFIYTIPVLFIFGFTQNIYWFYAFCLAMGNCAGAWLSVKVSVRKGDKTVKIILGVAIFIMAIKFLLTL